MELKTIARLYACGIIEEALFDDINKLDTNDASGAYRKFRYYWLSDKGTIKAQLVREDDEEKVTQQFRQAHPHENWTYVGPIMYGLEEHPIGANTLGDPSWMPDGEGFRKTLITEAKIAAILLSKRAAG